MAKISENKMMHTYYVTYSFTSLQGHGVEKTVIRADSPINTYQKINDIEKELLRTAMSEDEIQSLILLNWIKLEE